MSSAAVVIRALRVKTNYLHKTWIKVHGDPASLGSRLKYHCMAVMLRLKVVIFGKYKNLNETTKI